LPFPKQDLRPLNPRAITRLPAGQTGCYGLKKHGGWIYIGHGVLRDRLTEHLEGNPREVAKHEPSGFVVVATRDADRAAEVAKGLIEEYGPVCNPLPH